MRIGAFAVSGERVFLVDEVIPLLVEADARSGAVRRVHTWAVDPAQRGRPAATDVVVVGEVVLVTSPAGGGVVRVDLTSGAHHVVALDAPAGEIITDGSLVLVVADPDESDEDEDDWDEDDGEEGPVSPRAVWRLDGTGATPVDLGGDVHALAVVDGVAFAVVRRPSDPVVEREGPGGGWWHYSYPGAVVRWTPATAASVVAEVDDTGGAMVGDGDRVWLLGFAAEAYPVRELDPRTGMLAEPLAPGRSEPVGVSAGILLELDRTRRGARLTRRPVDGGPALPPLDLPAAGPEPRCVDGAVWFVADDGPELVCVEPSGEVRRIRVDLDCRAYLPPPTVPHDLDVARYEAEQLERLRGDLTGEWIDEPSGRREPFIAGVEITAVDRREAFPSTHVVALFRADTHPGIVFGRRWDLYDELGNPRSLRYADVHLMEDIEAAGHGLPPAGACVPDADGITWF